MGRVKLLIGFEVQIALVIADRKDVTELWTDPETRDLKSPTRSPAPLSPVS
jgi:hypothetical protein